MAKSDPTTPRERYRTQVRGEVMERAWEQIATAGASALSLNAIAKHMGMSGPALYRYFANRDELITELVREAYRDLADTLRTAADTGADLPGLARALRTWALADPQRYLLLYGTPVPGYQAPEDTRAISQEIAVTLIDACAATLPAATPSSPSPPTWPTTAPGPPTTPPRPRRSPSSSPSGPASTASCPSNWPATSPA